jgi:hypothetical protein
MEAFQMLVSLIALAVVLVMIFAQVRLFSIDRTLMALARAGKGTRAKAMVDELEKSYGWQTIVKVYWLPIIRAAMELRSNNVKQALVFLEAAAPYELGNPPQLQLGTLYPVWIRGQSYLSTMAAQPLRSFRSSSTTVGS